MFGNIQDQSITYDNKVFRESLAKHKTQDMMNEHENAIVTDAARVPDYARPKHYEFISKHKHVQYG